MPDVVYAAFLDIKGEGARTISFLGIKQKTMGLRLDLKIRPQKIGNVASWLCNLELIQVNLNFYRSCALRTHRSFDSAVTDGLKLQKCGFEVL